MASEAWEGGCRCGACRYVLAARPTVYRCHCTDCQTTSGSAFSEQAFMAAGDMTMTGPTIHFPIVTPSGATSDQTACAQCGTRLSNTNTGRPGFVVVRAGTLDRSHEIAPVAHIWTVSKQEWVVLPDAVARFDRMEPIADFLAVLMRGAA